ncbi:hypothetical protein GF420_15400 [candidate division GN15 bacterium]|nr:hypothetical protein [candidate division GN15 bacterium]
MRYIVLLLTGLILSGCGPTIPHEIAWRPWTRSLESDAAPTPGMSLSVHVNGESLPLLGSEVLLQNRIKGGVSELLVRRGYAIADSSVDLIVSVAYKTERFRELEVSSYHSSVALSDLYAATASGSGSASVSGDYGSGSAGVAIASTVARLLSIKSDVSSQTTRERTKYVHTLAIDMSSKDGQALWKGESTWATRTPDISGDIIGVSQLLLSELPADTSIIPRVPELKSSHFTNFLAEFCVNNYFSCPALPYRIYFPVSLYGWGTRIQWSSVEYIKDPRALAAFVDLVQTAEYALPTGGKEYEDPVDFELWERARLGGKYYLGEAHEPVYVIVDLYGTSTAYRVSSCRVVSQEEFSGFEEQLADWRQQIIQYFEMFR